MRADYDEAQRHPAAEERANDLHGRLVSEPVEGGMVVRCSCGTWRMEAPTAAEACAGWDAHREAAGVVPPTAP